MTDWPEDTLPSMALWLARHMHQVRRHEAAADIVAEVTAAVRAATRVIDRPAQRVYAGPCPACRTDLLAPPGRTQVTCTGCGTTHDIAERQAHMRDQLDDYLGTATYAAAILPGIGIHVSAGTIRVWASRHRLEVRAVVPAHPPSPEQHLFRLGDIVDLAIARDATRAGLGIACAAHLLLRSLCLISARTGGNAL